MPRPVQGDGGDPRWRALRELLAQPTWIEGLVGIVDITDVCRVLLEADVSGPSAAETDPAEATAAAAETASDP